MEPAVIIVLAGVLCKPTQWAICRRGIFVASNRARRLAIFQAEVSPQQVESLAAAVRQSLASF